MFNILKVAIRLKIYLLIQFLPNIALNYVEHSIND
jgi:hypothetical protein